MNLPIFLDRDGVLVGVLGDWEKGNPNQYQGAEMPLILPVIESLKGERVLILSNQRKKPIDLLRSQCDWLHGQLSQRRVLVQGTILCPDQGETAWLVGASGSPLEGRFEKSNPSSRVSFRKPDTGMGVWAEHLLGSPKYYIGDLSGRKGYAKGSECPDSDAQFANNMGWSYQDVQDWLSLVK